MRLLDNNECDDKSKKCASYFLFCGMTSTEYSVMTSLLRVADAEAKDRDIFGRGSGFRYFTMCNRWQTNKHCHTARLDMIVASPRTG